MLLRDPHQLGNEFTRIVMKNDAITIEEILEEAELMTKAEFMSMKKDWFCNLNFLWHIQGQVDREDALEMVQIVESMPDIKVMKEDDCYFGRSIRLNEKTVYERREDNRDTSNPNSYCKLSFWHCQSSDID